MLKVLKTIRIGEKDYFPGDMVEMVDDGRDWGAIRLLGLVEDAKEEVVAEEVIVETPVEVKEKDLTTDEKRDTVMPVIVKAGPRWKKVMLGEEQIGKTVGSDEEAEEIIAEWLEKQNK